MRRSGLLLCLLSVPLLSACENNVAAYEIEGRNHSITLVREQAYPFASEVKQALVAARFPDCQRRFDIEAGKPGRVKMEIWELRDRLFVARQGNVWYAIGTDKCQVQKMDPTGPQPPGRLIGSFRLKDDELVFEKAAAATEAPAKAD
jgi:hypothetical protein